MQVLVVQCANVKEDKIPDFSAVDLPVTLILAHSVEEAIALIKEKQPKLVIVDIEIEGGTGFRVFEETAEVTYEKAVLTENPNLDYKSIRYDVGTYLLKPLNEAELLETIQSLLFRNKANGIQQLYARKFSNVALAKLSHLFLPVTSKHLLLEVGHIIVVENIGSRRRIWTIDGSSIDTAASMHRIGFLLCGHGFARAGSALLLQPSHITRIGTEDHTTFAEMCNGRRIVLDLRMEGFIRRRWKRENDRGNKLI